MIHAFLLLAGLLGVSALMLTDWKYIYKVPLYLVLSYFIIGALIALRKK